MRALAGLLVLLVAACSGAVSPSSIPVPTSIGNVATAVIVSDGQSSPPSLQPTPTVAQSRQDSDAVIDCGEILVSGQPPSMVSDHALASGSTACFTEAYKACHAATLSVRDSSAGILRQFAILANSGSRCDLRQALQTDPNAPPATADCTGMRPQDDGLLIQGCSHLGDYLIPGILR